MAVVLSANALTSSLFDELAGYLGNPSGVDAFLVGKGVDARIAQAVTTAIAAADGTPVTITSGITLNQILQSFVPSASMPSGWSSNIFTALTFSCSAADADGRTLGFAGTLTGPLAVTIQDLTLDFTASLTLTYTVPSGAATGEATGSLSGTVSFAEQDFAGSYDFGADGQILMASWSATDDSTLGLTAILTQFKLGALAAATDDVLEVLALQSATFTLDLSDTNVYTLSIDATAARGNAFVVAQYESGWTVAAGVELTDITIDKVPLFGDALGDTTGLDLGFQLPAAVVLAASGAIEHFVVPDRSGDDTPWPFDSFSLDVEAGVMLAAVLDLKGSTATVASNLVKILPSSGQLLLEATLPDLTLRVELGGSLKILRCFQFDATLEFEAPFVVSLEGTVTIPGSSKIGGLECEAAITLTPETATGSLELDYPKGFNPPLPFMKGVWLYELAGMIGLDFDKQEATLGLMGKFSIGTSPDSGGDGSVYQDKAAALVSGVVAQQSQTASLELDEFAIIVGVNDDAVVAPIPDLDLLILRLSTLSVPALMTAILGDDAPSVSADVFQAFAIDDLQIYWCDDAPGGLALPDGTMPTTGLRFRGLFDVWHDAFQAWVELDATLEGGVATDVNGQLYLSPIDIGGMLHVTNDGSVSPPADVVARITQAQLDPDGPFLTFGAESPFLTASCAVRLLDCTETIGVTLTSDGGTLMIANQDGTNFSSGFDCTVTNDWKTLTVKFAGYLNGTLTLPIVVGIALGDLAVGKESDVVVNATYSATMVVDVSDGFSLTIDGTFTLDNDTRQWNLPHVALNVKLDSLADIPTTLLDWIGKDADSVFQDAIEACGTEFVKFVGKTWDEMMADVENSYQDIKHAVERFLGIHKTKRPSAPWLANGAIITAQGGSITSDPKDRNYTVNAFYVVRDLQRVFVPDMATLGQISPNAAFGNGIFSSSTTDDFDPAFVISIPPAPVEYPSVTAGVFFWAADENHPNTTLYLSIPFYRDTNQNFGHYQIADAATYQTQIDLTKQTVQLLPCNPGDTPGDDNTPLDTVCLITDDTSVPKDMFFDGLRRHVPDPPTLAILDQKHYGTATQLPSSAFAATPQGPDLTSLTNGMLVKTADNPAIYYITGNQLCHVPTQQDLDDWGLSGITVTTLDDQNMSVLAIGPDLKRKPD